ncbi:MAG: GGDEF domain-containing protein [Eubacterium sp.]|nr:GGDEF domain-containing protein [Eubacterium sp.]
MENAIWLDFLPDVLSVLAILIGIALIIFILVNFRNTEVNRSLLFMGLFSVWIGVWKFSDTTSAALFFENSLIAAYVPFISLLLAIVPFTMFVRTLFSNRESKAWYVVCFSSIAVTLLTFIAQITGFADMRETLSLNQGVMLVLAIVSIIEVVKEWRKKGLNKDLKLTMYCVLTCVVGLVVDTVIYYATHGIGMKICGIVCFLAYVLVLGVKSILESKELMARGEKAKKFEQMAYHDQLTGLYNRTAYAKDTNKMNDMDNCVAFMMDLNNLKLCNDTKGHDAGDNYIYASAKLIREIFGKYGKCYRMGGDEFCVLTNQLDVFACRSLLDELETNIKKYNEKHPEDFPVHIASGFAEYDKEKDYDFGDTLRRADRLMYKRKMEMKQII